MSTKFHGLRVREVRRETPDAVSIAFDVPAELAQEYRFIQGQYLTIRVFLNGEEVRRSYSVCSGAHDGELRVAVKKVTGGLFSTYANTTLQAGDVLEVMPPMGRFYVPLDPAQRRQYVAFAAGSGITPIMSLIKTTLVEEPQSQFMLFFGNRGFDHILFREQLEHLKNTYPDRLAVHHVLSRESLGSKWFQGRLDAEKCRNYGRVFFNPAEVDAFFLCGPEDMTFSVKEALEAMGVEAGRIHMELFAVPGAHKPKPASTEPRESFDASIRVIQDGMEFDFALASDGSTLLDAAMRAGADLPFSCKGGVCSTCKARVLEGEVEMEVNYGLEPDELAAGYVLTCQSHPKTKRVVVSFDL
jgi:ring-1,2-phenylacetyl-CoA epoxidase subunit PaaE